MEGRRGKVEMRVIEEENMDEMKMRISMVTKIGFMSKGNIGRSMELEGMRKIREQNHPRDPATMIQVAVTEKDMMMTNMIISDLDAENMD